MREKLSKKKMLNKARTLFWSKGYHATSMRDIASAYGCKPANIYNFFTNKEDILYQVLVGAMESVITPILPIADDTDMDPVEQVRLIITSHLKVNLKYRRATALLFDMAMNFLPTQKQKKIVDLRDKYDKIIRNVVKRGVDSGCFPEIDAKLASFMIISMLARTRIWFHPKKGLSIDELADFIFNFAIGGLSGSDSPKALN
jgi:TetR/AcrR family transcriptional regulator, cholesterol catabolism regulator